MRYLNKIVFINSAYVPYAEIKLDGNVHFIGTQGVGKSTLLRAILFFYNVDKSKLGIRTQDKQKSYDEFYLPHPNSYIIYEVERETGKFFVMTFLSRGRTAFRIVDCAYDKRFFIEADGMARAEWREISEAIGTDIFKSNIIRGYEEFRDIIYGNSQNVAKELRRFSIMESSKYQNIPRTIQNIFLNQSLESRVIKDTIIDSMDFANDSINLNLYREHTRCFQQQYEDIWKWYKHEKNGTVKVQVDADNVISKYILYEQLCREIKELCGQLNYGVKRDTALLPTLGEQEEKLQQELSRQRRLLSEEENKYNSERDKLNQLIGTLKSFLETVKKKRQHYESIGIERIAKRIGKEGELKIRQENLKKQEALLSDKNQEVKQKYDALLKDLDNLLREYQLQTDKQILDIERNANEESARQNEEATKAKDEANERYNSKGNELHEQLANAQNEKNDLRLTQQKYLTMNPFSQEMEELKKKGEKLLSCKSELAIAIADKQQEINTIERDVELRRKDIEQQCEKDIALIDRKRETIEQEIAKLDELLSQQKGSLIEWLGNNVKGWEHNIGKVLDEANVLYNTQLNPRFEGSSANIYGVAIDTDCISNNVRTPKEISEQKIALEKEASALKQQMSERRSMFVSDIAEMERKPRQRLKTLRTEKMNLDAELRIIPQTIERTKKEQQTLEDQLSEWRKQKIYDLNRDLAKVEKVLNTLQSQLKVLEAQRNKEIDNISKTLRKKLNDISARANQQRKEAEVALDVKRKDIATQKNELQARMDAELKGLGVDVDQLNAIRQQQQTILAELTFIDSHRQDYAAWLNDKREYFANEQAKTDEYKKTKQKLDDLGQHFNERKRKLDNAIQTLNTDLKALQEKQGKIVKTLESIRNFKLTPSCPVDFVEAEDKKTSRPLSDIFEDLKANIMDKQRRMEDFKQAVDIFKTNFSAQNTFGFRTEFNGPDNYVEFAIDLNEFISNKKIEEYRTRTSERYANIINQIAREVSDLNQHEADIRNTINEINKDFRDNNFVGVIKDIELRVVESNDRLMQQLLNIKRFSDENSFNIGQLNLFSNENTLDRTNQQAVKLLMTLIDQMDAESKRETITLADTFKLEFKVKENDNDTSWVEKLSNVGSDGTDILVKAMVNIMLINVFKRKASRKFGDFTLHCMMDEIGKLHPNNVQGILDFANKRNIRLINSSPTTYNATAYKYTYALSKDLKSNTIVKTLLTIR